MLYLEVGQISRPHLRHVLRPNTHCSVNVAVTNISAELPWADNEVKIQTSRSFDGKKIIVAKEGSDVHIICKTSASGVSVEWTMNEFIQLTRESDRIEMTTRNLTSTGRWKTLHTLIIRNTSTTDAGVYKCQSGTPADEVHVRVVRTTSTPLTISRRWLTLMEKLISKVKIHMYIMLFDSLLIVVAKSNKLT